MQQETPQVNQPAPQVPMAGPPTPQKPEENGADFYQPAAPAAYQPIAPSLPAPVASSYDDDDTLTWEASEYIHTDKGGLWLVGFIAIAVIVLGVGIWLQAWTFVVLTVAMALAMGVFAFRPPHVLRYTITNDGIIIGGKTYRFDDFRAFGILQDGAFFTMTLIPLKRFAPALSVYFAEDHGEDIVDMVGEHLPMEQVEPDIIDNLMRRLRF